MKINYPTVALSGLYCVEKNIIQEVFAPYMYMQVCAIIYLVPCEIIMHKQCNTSSSVLLFFVAVRELTSHDNDFGNLLAPSTSPFFSAIKENTSWDS